MAQQVDFVPYEHVEDRDGSILWDVEERRAYNGIAARAADERLQLYRLVIAGSDIMVAERRWDLETVARLAERTGRASEVVSGSGLRWRRATAMPGETPPCDP